MYFLGYVTDKEKPGTSGVTAAQFTVQAEVNSSASEDNNADPPIPIQLD